MTLRYLILEVMARPVGMLVIRDRVEAHNAVPVGVDEPVIFGDDKPAVGIRRLFAARHSQHSGVIAETGKRLLPNTFLNIGLADIVRETDHVIVLQPVLRLQIRQAKPIYPLLGRRQRQLFQSLVLCFLNYDGHEEPVLFVFP